MAAEFQERRRSPRVASDGTLEFRGGRRMRVRLIDISACGALLLTDERLPIGSTGRILLLLGGSPFESAIEVKREEPASDGRGRLAGVSMKAAHSADQELLDQFLRRAGA